MDFKDFKLLIWLIILKLFKDFWNGDNKKVLVEILMCCFCILRGGLFVIVVR